MLDFESLLRESKVKGFITLAEHDSIAVGLIQDKIKIKYDDKMVELNKDSSVLTYATLLKEIEDNIIPTRVFTTQVNREFFRSIRSLYFTPRVIENKESLNLDRFMESESWNVSEVNDLSKLIKSMNYVQGQEFKWLKVFDDGMTPKVTLKFDYKDESHVLGEGWFCMDDYVPILLFLENFEPNARCLNQLRYAVSEHIEDVDLAARIAFEIFEEGFAFSEQIRKDFPLFSIQTKERMEQNKKRITYIN